jgi:hypothetical protein
MGLPSVAWAQSNPLAGGGSTSADARLWAYQKTLLDPQAELTGNDIPPTQAGMHHDMSTMAASADLALPPEIGGKWDYLPPFPAEFNAVHTVTGPNGKILLVAGSGKNKTNFEAGSFTSYIWDPVSGQRRMIPTPEDLFCAGHVLLPDGRALVGGGTTGYVPFKGAKALYAFNFVTEAYEKLTPLEVARWYPATVTGPDGRVLFVSGFDEFGVKTNTTESFNYKTNTHNVVPSLKNVPLYARLHLASNGRFYVAERSGTGFWDPYKDLFQPVGGFLGKFVTDSTYASCFVGDVRDQNLMVLGGGWPATNVTTLIDLDAPAPIKRAGPPLKAAKGYVGCVNLPDGTLFEANGGTENSIAGASSEAGLLTSVSAQWTPMNPLPQGEHRVYHSMLFLMDSGQVISMTSNPDQEARSGSLLVYSPPYLFKGAAPVITSAPVEVTYGTTYPVGASATGATVDRITITTPSSVTHSMDNNQRYVSLKRVNGMITMPSMRTILPPGWYRMWAVDTQGRVSVARWIHLTQTTASAPAAPSCCCTCGGPGLPCACS